MLKDLLKDVAKMIEAVPELSTVPVVVSDPGELSSDMKTKIARNKVAATVWWNGFAPNVQLPGRVVGEAGVVVTVFESPSVNRARVGALSASEISRRVALALACRLPPGAASKLVLNSISPVSNFGGDAGPGVVSCDVEFKVKAEL